MVQTVTEKGERIVDFKLLENQLLTDIMPYIEKKFRVGRTKKMRAMAGLSMGSLQTSIIGFKHPEYFSSLGIFSGFVTDIIQGSPLDMVDRGTSENEHMKILDDAKVFNKTFDVYFRAMGDKDPFWENFAHDDQILNEKGIDQIRNVYPGAHDWTYGACAFMISHSLYLNKNCFMGKETDAKQIKFIKEIRIWLFYRLIINPKR